VKELEKAGIPATLICTLTSIAVTVGANRIIPALGIPHPLGDPKLSPQEEKAARKNLVAQAIKLLGSAELSQEKEPRHRGY
jgi:betaine reductase